MRRMDRVPRERDRRCLEPVMSVGARRFGVMPLVSRVMSNVLVVDALALDVSSVAFR